MGRIYRQILFNKRYIGGQWLYEEMYGIRNYQEGYGLNYNYYKYYLFFLEQ